MQKIGNWWTPDTETDPRTLRRIREERWSCAAPLLLALAHVKRFETCLDIGAWIGDSTAFLAERFKRVVAFEASPPVFECCLRNMQDRRETNGAPEVIVHNVALSDCVRKGVLFNSKSTGAGWVDTIGHNGKGFAETEVHCATLDSYKFQDIDFVKIDVDGHEGFLLQGAKKFFEANSPVVMIENKERTFKHQSPKMPSAVKFLESVGYAMVEEVSHIDLVFVRNKYRS